MATILSRGDEFNSRAMATMNTNGNTDHQANPH